MNAMGSMHEMWTRFFGLYTALNVGMYLISVCAVLLMRGALVRRCAEWFGLSEEAVRRASFQWLVAYKLGIVMFALTPWIALMLIA